MTGTLGVLGAFGRPGLRPSVGIERHHRVAGVPLLGVVLSLAGAFLALASDAFVVVSRTSTPATMLPPRALVLEVLAGLLS
jgi:hypothetical protein